MNMKGRINNFSHDWSRNETHTCAINSKVPGTKHGVVEMMVHYGVASAIAPFSVLLISSNGLQHNH